LSLSKSSFDGWIERVDERQAYYTY